MSAGSFPALKFSFLLISARLLPGLTPAHAGKIFCDWITPKRRQAHPRAYGDYCASVLNSIPFSGSPPRMRGK